MIEIGRIFVAISNSEEGNLFLKALWSPNEISAVTNRWKVIQMLRQGGMSQREVRTQLQLGIGTVTRSAATYRDHRFIIEKLVDRC
jgi:Trp operon repressor